MALNISRPDFIDVINRFLSGQSLQSLDELLSDLEADEENGAARRRATMSADALDILTTLETQVNVLKDVATRYGLLKNGEKATKKVVAEAAPAAEEKTFKLVRVRERTYTFADGSTVVIPNPVSVTVRASGNRDVRTASGRRIVVHKGYLAYHDVKG